MLTDVLQAKDLTQSKVIKDKNEEICGLAGIVPRKGDRSVWMGDVQFSPGDLAEATITYKTSPGASENQGGGAQLFLQHLRNMIDSVLPIF
jgi:hypothetical protein